MNREQRKQLAEETIRIVEAGYYVNRNGQRVDIATDVARVIANTKLYSPESLESLVARPTDCALFMTQFEVTNETTLSAAHRLVVGRSLSNVLALNFASARNPGGGFLSGSQAQEESLARSSALYASLCAAPEFYGRNQACDSALYTHYMILSANVPVFRDDDGGLLNQPYTVSFLTSPAVNAGADRKNTPRLAPQIKLTMATRAEFVLSLALAENYRHLILGAWGCGVFQNDPNDVAAMFAELLTNGGRFDGHFESVTFAVLDHSPDKSAFSAFGRSFKRSA